MSALREAAARVAATDTLLVACDFDGTLAPIVSDPSTARADPECVQALAELVKMPRTHVAIVSGRSLRDLQVLTGSPPGVVLVGSHGAEFGAEIEGSIPDQTRELHQRVLSELQAIARSAAGLFLEIKPVSVALHYRAADEDEAARAMDAVMAGPARLEGVTLRHGKKVVELSVVGSHKGGALERIRALSRATATVFVGDDPTDEDAFAALGPGDLAVKVGAGPTRAPFSVSDVPDVASILRTIAAQRCAVAATVCPTAIEQHAMLSDQRAVAIVTPGGRIDWLCLPRLDSSAIFAQLVDTPAAGFFEIRPAAGGSPRRCGYVGDSFVLQTAWDTLTVTDYLDCSAGRAFQRAGRSDLIRVISGSGVVRITFSPRLDFGRIATKLLVRDAGLEIDGSLDPIVLSAPGVRWEIRQDGPHQTASADVEVRPDAPLVLELRYGTASLRESAVPEPARRDGTVKFWASWAGSLRLPSQVPELVRRSALALRALIHGPSGALAAAATTSLPEMIGGVRNWDYRFCWPRDAALACSALLRLGNTGCALRFLDWLLAVVEKLDTPERLRPIYTVTGGHLGSEGELAHLAGYRGSRPVRVGNAAAAQVQLDVFGPLVDLVYQLGAAGAPLTPEHWRLVEAVVQAVEHRWTEPDHGIWEIRAERRHHVHSKVMCWTCVDRGMRVAEQFLGKDRPQWADLRDRIAADVLEKGVKQGPGGPYFAASYEQADPDAAALHVGLSGLVPPDDPRFINTIDAVERALREGPVVRRYRYPDGLPGNEGGFLICAAWLGQAYQLTGRRDRAQEILDGLVRLAGPTGLLPEQFDNASGLALGNFPQAYSHLALIDLAVALEGAPATPAPT